MNGNRFNPSPMGQYNPRTTNMNPIQSNQAGRFNTAFNPMEQMIPHMDYTNPGVAHNNIAPNVMNEHIVEYKIHIDSADRDTRVFKDPYKYIVTFNSPGATWDRNMAGEKVKTSGPPAPHISREFKNVKYVKLNSITLPRYTMIYDADPNGYQFNTESESTIYDDRFVVLRIKELQEDSDVCATNGNVDGAFGLIYPDKLVSSTHYFGLPYSAQKIFKSSKLGNITKLTIELLDSYGNPIKVTEVDGAGAAPTTVPNDPLVAPNENEPPYTYSIPTTDRRHPLNKEHQNHITLIIGVVESQIDTNTKFFQ